MIENNTVYFAPAIPFADVNFEVPAVADQLQARLEGWYLRPAEECMERSQLFAATTLLLSGVEFWARLHGSDSVSLVKRLPSFQSVATELWDRFRCGLAHEGRIKAGDCVSIEASAPSGEGRIVVDPRLLLNAFRQRVRDDVDAIRCNPKLVSTTLKRWFAKDFELAGRQGRAR